MMRLLLLLSLCVSAFGQFTQYPQVFTNFAHLAAANPNNLRAAVVIATNGNVQFAYSATATDATNTSTTSPILKPVNFNGRWFGKKDGQGGSGSGDLIAANNLSDVSNTLTALSNLGGIARLSNIAAIRTLSAATSAALGMIFVQSDADGFPGCYVFDATITSGQDDGNGIIALTAGGGGFERKGL